MARDLSCPTGRKAYKTKRAAKVDAGERPIVRCDRCRWHHIKETTRRGGGTRK